MVRVLIGFVSCVFVASSASAQTGVSDDRVAIPDGPGSVEGLGDNASVTRNMGLMSYGVPFELPAGFPTATPALGLSYGSGSGNSVVGIGWSMQVPSIERLTLRGLPTYDSEDEFVADGSEQLVRVSTEGTKAVYRARFERGFVRYTWFGVGAAGYWKAEFPDGTVGYYGATSSGTLVPEARLAGPDGRTFRYHLVERVDGHGDRIVFDYQKFDGSPYLVRVGYAHDGDGVPRYTATLAYVTRGDAISDCKPGFEERTTRRLASVSVATSGELIRRYALAYETLATSGGLSRLARVERSGRDGTPYPIAFDFGYSRSLAGVCSGGVCGDPFVVSMGTLPTGSAIRTGNATLVDLDADALPDVVDTSADGAHSVVFNRLAANGRSAFDPTIRRTTAGSRADFSVSLPTVQEIDVNGDGLTDLVNTNPSAPGVLCNDGSGDWRTSGCGNDGDLGLLLGGSSGNDPTSVRFLDVDGDRRIDAIYTPDVDTTMIRRNDGITFVDLPGVEPIGVVFDQAKLLLADMNGDGLLDPVHFFANGAVRFRKNLGFGRWSDWVDLAAPALDAAQLAAAGLEDLNGDGLDDLVVVESDAVSYALNRAATAFDPSFTRLTAQTVSGLPTRHVDTTVLFADMNANGSLDVVWVQIDGRVDYLELFPVQPNLLARIENGIGMVQTITYGTAADQRRRDPGAWTHPLAVPATVVTRLDTWTSLTGGENGVGLHEISDYGYVDGLYAGAEKELRGFARVERISPTDDDRDTQEGGRLVESYELGSTDPYRKGLLSSRSVWSRSGTSERALSELRSEYADCGVAGVPTTGLAFPVRHLCETSTITILQEGASAAEWATTRTTTTYDGYGRPTKTSELGVVAMGSPESQSSCGACVGGAGSFGAACGPTCGGDERFTETTYITPGSVTGGRWILDRAQVVRHYGAAGGIADEVRTFYDGAAFVGLPGGQLTAGDVTRVTSLRATGDFVDSHRFARDAHGNVIAAIDPVGSVADETTHRRSYVYDAVGLHLVRSDVHLVTPEGTPYRLRRELTYDPAFDVVTESTGYMVVEGTTNRSARKATSYRYDTFARRVAVIEPGDTDAAPTITYSWFLASPASRVVERRSTARGGPLDLERVICLDGRGRAFQERTRISGTSYQVTGFAEYNSRGAAVRLYQPYLRSSGFCDTTAPTGVLYEDVVYDAADREIRRVRSDGAERPGASETATVYGPLSVASYDEVDLDASHPQRDTPVIRRVDGLGRTVAVERRLVAGSVGPTTRIELDGLGRIAALVDADGHRKVQRHDLLGNLVGIDDPNAGSTSFERDAGGNVVARTDARGATVRTGYDGANRIVAQWDDDDVDATIVRLRYDYGGTCDVRDCSNAEGNAIAIDYPIDDALLGSYGGAARGVDGFGFDARGRATFSSRTVAGLTLVTRREFDSVGRRIATVHPDGRRVALAYDGASRVVSVDGVIRAVTYDDRGDPVAIDHANGASDLIERDARVQVVHRTVASADGTPIEDIVYGRDRAGAIETIVDSADGPSTYRTLDARFERDGLGRIVSAEHRRASGDSEVQAFVLDAIDNVLSVTSSDPQRVASFLGAIGYDGAAPNAATSVGGIGLTYDEAGELTSRGDLEFSWDHLGRLVGASREDEVVARFSYGFGTSRVASIDARGLTIHGFDDFELRDGIGVAYVRVGRQRVARLESDTLATEFYGDTVADGEVNAADAFALRGGREPDDTNRADGTAVLRSAARRLLSEAGDGRATLHTDPHGSLVAATDADGHERGRRRYAFSAGEDRQVGFVDRYGFTGQEEFPELGLVRFEHRWLDTTTRRWTKADPAFASVSELTTTRAGEAADPYAYVGNDPIDRFDPTGLYTRGTGAADVVARHGEATAMATAAHQHVVANPPAGPALAAAQTVVQRASIERVANGERNGQFRVGADTALANGTEAIHGTGVANQAHHLLPFATMGAHAAFIRRGARGGFDAEGAANRLIIGTDVHRGSHGQYNELVHDALTQLEAHLGAGASDAAVAEGLRHLAASLARDIDADIAAGAGRMSLDDSDRPNDRDEEPRPSDRDDPDRWVAPPSASDEALRRVEPA